MRAFLLFITIITLLFASDKKMLYDAYQSRNFEAACSIGIKNYAANIDDREFIALTAFGCLESDNISAIATLLPYMNRNKEDRANAAYFSVILMQKSLLLHALVDGYSLHALKMPSSDYILSKIFDWFQAGKGDKLGQYFFFKEPSNSKHTYKLYLLKNRSYQLVVEEYYDTIMTKRHKFK